MTQAPPNIPWYHSYDLGDHKIDGTQPLGYLKWREQAIFDNLDLQGKSVLDKPEPTMVYLPRYEPDEWANYFIPNALLVKHLLLDNGFKTVRITPDCAHYNDKDGRAIFHAAK